MEKSQIKIIADSSADIYALDSHNFAAVPLKIITDAKEYVDNESLDVSQMALELSAYKGRSSTACPSPEDYLEAFDGAQYIFCVTITSGLSGSYNSAEVAKNIYLSQNPTAKVHIIDSLSAGPELYLTVKKLEEYIDDGLDFDAIVQKITGYNRNTGLLFILESVQNFANNGRISPLVAKMTGLLGIRIVGKASDAGTLEVLHKSRGEKRAFEDIIASLKKFGYTNGKLRISHCDNPGGAKRLYDRILSEFENAKLEIGTLGGLCSFYAEKGGLLIGYEKN